MTRCSPSCRRRRWSTTTTSIIRPMSPTATTRSRAPNSRASRSRRSSRARTARTPAVFNNAGQHYNHLHFWKWMKPNGGGAKLPGALEKTIIEDLGGVEKFKEDFVAAGVGQFGSGWAWLEVKDGKLAVTKTAQWREPAGQRRDPDPRLRRLGALLLHRLPQPPPRLSQGLRREPGELGVCRRAVLEGLRRFRSFRGDAQHEPESRVRAASHPDCRPFVGAGTRCDPCSGSAPACGKTGGAGVLIVGTDRDELSPGLCRRRPRRVAAPCRQPGHPPAPSAPRFPRAPSSSTSPVRS